jgi:hypothetical protein
MGSPSWLVGTFFRIFGDIFDFGGDQPRRV